MKKARIRLLVVDDHRLMREGIASLIGREADFEIAGLMASGEEAITGFRALRPDIVLMDLRLPRMSGVEAIRAIRRDDTAAKIVVLTAYESPEDVYQAMQAGATTYLVKDTLPSDLADTIRKVYAGERPLRPEIEARLAERNSQSALTSREVEVVELVARGMRNKEIAFTLHISEETVHVHLRKIYLKLNVNDRTGMMAEAIRRGVVRIS
jgi:two-component system NarL family response regulator